MTRGSAGTVFRKELRETLRDRRTLIVMVVVPVFLYPALLVILFQLALFGQRQLEQDPTQVAVVGGGPAARAALAADTSLRVVPLDAVPLEAVRSGAVDAVVQLPSAESGALATTPVRVLFDASRDRSLRARDAVRARLDAWGDSLLVDRLRARGLPATFAAPLAVADSSVASAERMGGYALGRFLPMLLLVMTLLGAFFPAIDLTAGEKERATLETLLTSPVPNRDIVIGKFSAVVVIAVAAAALNLGSMLLTFQSGLFRMGEAASLRFSLPAATVGVVLLCLIPLAVFFAALFMGIAVRAQSFKEAQNSLTPVQFAALVPMYLPLIPGIPFSYGVAVVPIGGVAMLFRELMSGSAPPGPSLVALGATVVYAALALRFAARSFGREEVLFGSGTEGAAPMRWRERVRAWRRAPREAPRAAEALLFVAAVGLLYFYVGIRLQLADVERGLLASQWLLLALPAVLFAALGPFRFRGTLALRAPTPRALAAAALIIAGGIPIGWTLAWVQSLFVEVPAAYLEAFQDLLSADSPGRLLWLLLLFAATPAICEELVFRGVLLQGLSRELPMARAVVGSALVFGAFHLSFETFVRFLPTAWLGVLLGWVAWRTRSIVPGMLMHFLNNASVLLLVANAGVQGYFVGPEGEPRWPVVALAAILLALGARLLPRRPAGPAPVAAPPPGAREAAPAS
jgi:sodium transport system permease protein